MSFRTAYGERVRSTVQFVDENGDLLPTITQQHCKNDCDVNHILKKYDQTGLITHVNRSVAQYGDFTEVNEYQESLNMVINAQNAFAELPSDIRKQFNNDPGAFFEFATNPANTQRMIEMGLAEAVSQPNTTSVSEPTAPTEAE